MQKITIKLERNEYIAIYNAMKMIDVQPFTASLKYKAQYELLQKLFMRMTQKIFTLQAKCTYSLTVAEAWAFFEKMPSVMNRIGIYEQNAVQKVINAIHQQTA